MPWKEGFTNSNRILKALAMALCRPRGANGYFDSANAWTLVYPDPSTLEQLVTVTGEILTPDEARTVYSATNKPIDVVTPPTVKKNGVALASPADYTLSAANGTVTLAAPAAAEDVITMDYKYNDGGVAAAVALIGTNADKQNERFVVKTTTTPVTIDPAYQNDETGLGVASITQFMEFYKPYYILNPETCLNNYVDTNGMVQRTSRNQHHILIRQYDLFTAVRSVATEKPVMSNDKLTLTLKNKDIVSNTLKIYMDGAEQVLATLGGTLDAVNGTITFTDPLMETPVLRTEIVAPNDLGLVGTGDGNTKTFNLKKAPIKPNSSASVCDNLKIYLGGVSQETATGAPSGWSYNASTGQITFTNAPGMGVQITADYRYLTTEVYTVDYNYNYNGPTPDIYDASGNIVTRGAHVSEWAKMAWFKDWEEQLKTVPGQSYKTMLMVQASMPNLVDGIPIQYWVQMDKNHAVLMLMGEPSIDYNNFMTSFAYLGKLDSFEGSLNDTAGNFALTTSSSTIPAKIGIAPTEAPVMNSIAQPEGQVGTLNDNYTHGYLVTYMTDNGESPPSQVRTLDPNKSVIYLPGTGANTSINGQKGKIKISFTLPAGNKGYRIYRKSLFAKQDTDINAWAANTTNLSQYRLLTSSDESVITMEFEDAGQYDAGWGTAQAYAPPITGRPVTSIKRDGLFKNIVEVLYPSSWGNDTANGVTDVCMLKTRGGAYYQAHRLSYSTPDEQMTRVAFNPSRWTEKFHLSPVSVVHPFDGYRGLLKNVMVVDSMSIAPLDELVVNKGSTDPQKPEETYMYFKVNCPYSAFVSGPNAFYGVAVKKV